ncbi:uncharacterized protein EV154DRAFT_569811 [Mucor mucedo]|uniref:uncharacterized protein n=1 Tax=Mucor mucedo TaxID=29922 RepID=UPI00222106AC|nr:uncharacterized protein EV154DRAFT_569811 [Mucor mucedo]KAI7874076.1 hypothetical protein EV154DRAFT_569811 [Mucor mucedo]
MPTTVYTSLSGETIDNCGDVAVLDEAVDQTIEYLVTSMNEIEARRLEHGEPERRKFTKYVARSTTFFGHMLESMEKRDQVQSRIGDNNNATSYNPVENGDYNYTNNTSHYFRPDVNGIPDANDYQFNSHSPSKTSAYNKTDANNTNTSNIVVSSTLPNSILPYNTASTPSANDMTIDGKVTTVSPVTTHQPQPPIIPLYPIVDAFITYGLRDIPLLPDNRVRFYLSPPFSTRITRLDYGTYEHHNFKMPVKDYHHTLLFTMDGQCHLEIHIIFPNMKELGVEMDSDASVLDSFHQAKFANELFLPAVKVSKDRVPSAYNRCGSSYEQSAARGVHNALSLTLWTEELSDIVDIMRDMVREKQSLAMFRHFRFVLSAFGFKAPLRRFSHTAILSNMIDRNQLAAVQTRVDIGLNIFAVSDDDNHMSLGRFGGMSGKNPAPAINEAWKMIMYNDVKIRFTRARQGFNGYVGEDWSPPKSRATINHATGHWRQGLNFYERCLHEHQETQFTSRLGVRVSAADVCDILVRKLMDGLHRLQSNGAFIHFFVDEYLAYVRELLNVTSEMMVSLSRDVQLPAVSGFAFCVFLLNSLMHPADKGSTCCNNFVKTHRCKKNYLFFMSYHFVFDLNEWRFIDAFDSTRMADMFPGLSFVRTLVVDGDRLVNEIDRMAAANEINPENVHLAHDVALNNTVSYTVSLGPLTFAPCLRFSKTPLSRHRVPGTWLTNQAIPMFDVGNADTVRYAEKTRQIFHRFGLGPESAVRFLEVFFEEYFSMVGGGHTGCNIENLSFGGDQSMFDPELRDALDLTHRERAWVQSLVTDDRMDRSWKAFGSRSVFLELFLHADISSRSLKHLHCILLAASVYILEYVPMSCPTKMFRRTSSTTIATRKVSWFLEPMGDVSREMFQFLQDYAYDHKFEDPSFPRVYRRVTEIHGSRVGGRTIPRVRARNHRRNGRLI